MAAALVAFAALAGAPGVAGPPNQISLDLTTRLEALSERLAEPEGRTLSTAILMAQSGLAEAARLRGIPATPASAPQAGASLVPAAPPVAQRLNMRLALTMLSQAQGDTDNGAVVGAQSDPNLSALVLTRGEAGLDDLRRLAQEQGLAHDAAGQALLLRVPLVIWAGAALTLAPGDELRLSRPDGAFVMNFGELRLHGATIVAAGDTNPRIPRFAPFVTTTDGGTLQFQGARLVGLGFGTTPKFSGVSVLRSLIAAPARPTRIEDSLFQGLQTVSVGADAGILVRGNRFHDSRGPALVVVRTTGATIMSNFFSGEMPTNAIRLETGSELAMIAGNVILGGERAGIVVRNAAPGVTVAGNVVWRREGSGIVFNGSDCGRIEGNLLIENEQKGIEMRRSRDALLVGNRLLSNENAAVWVSDQEPGAMTILMSNEIAFNGAGLAGAGGQDILLDGNDFSEQYLQFLSGDLAPQSPHLARNMTGRARMVLSTAGLSEAPPELPTCFG